MNMEAGTVLGSYRIIDTYRRGGMATVYRAQDVGMGRQVAIKVIRPTFLGDRQYAEYVARFRREAMTVAQLRHPNILRIYSYGEANGMPYLVMEFVDGGTLAERLGTPRAVADVVQLLRPIAAALDYAHRAGVLHRDVKPSNILLWSNGTPVLGDFGIAKRPGNRQDFATQIGEVIGTPEYMAPEQALATEVGPATDQYALAVVAYEMLTGRVPFTGTTPLAMHVARRDTPLPRPRTINPTLSPAAEAALLKALALRPEERFPAVSAFIDQLDAAGRSRQTARLGPVRWLQNLSNRLRGLAVGSAR